MKHEEQVSINALPQCGACFCFKLGLMWGAPIVNRRLQWSEFEPRYSQLRLWCHTSVLPHYPYPHWFSRSFVLDILTSLCIDCSLSQLEPTPPTPICSIRVKPRYEYHKPAKADLLITWSRDHVILCYLIFFVSCHFMLCGTVYFRTFVQSW